MAAIDVVFWTCLILGSMYCLVTLLTGVAGHGSGHAHVGHHIGHLDLGGHDAGHVPVGAGHTAAGHAGDAGGPHGAEAHGGHAHGEGGHGAAADDSLALRLLGYLNPMSIASFLIGFGWTGIICRMLHASLALSLLCATAAGSALFGVAALAIVRLFSASGATSHSRADDAIGLSALVTAPIAGQQPGMISFTVCGCRQSIRAVCDDGDGVPVGSTVRIRRIEAQTAHVVVLDQQTPQLLGR